MNIETIQKTIDEEIQPALDLHNGSCKAVSYSDGLLVVSLFGGCVGCPSSRLTLFDGILPILQQKYPEIKDIELQ